MYRKTLITIIFCILNFHLGATTVYKIIINSNRAQTGFKIKYQKGIVTALHGIAGFKHITIINTITNSSYQDEVYISKIDYKNDVCVLESELINKIKIDEGFDIAERLSATTLRGKDVKVVGYPLGIFLDRETSLQVENLHPLIEMQRLITDVKTAQILSERKSPEININVLNLNGNLLPGHSGAPILFNNEVIGIAEGGLDNGRVGIGFAIPIKFIQLEDFKDNYKYRALVNSTNTLFSSEYSTTESGISQIYSTFRTMNQESIVDFKNVIGDKIDQSTYRCKVNYLDAIGVEIDIDAEVGPVKVGTLDLFLCSTVPNDSWVKSLQKVDKESEAYLSIHNAYLLTKRLLHDCFQKEIVSEGNGTNLEYGVSEHYRVELNNDTYIVLYLLEGRLMLSFYNHAKLQDDVD